MWRLREVEGPPGDDTGDDMAPSNPLAGHRFFGTEARSRQMRSVNRLRGGHHGE